MLGKDLEKKDEVDVLWGSPGPVVLSRGRHRKVPEVNTGPPPPEDSHGGCPISLVQGSPDEVLFLASYV